MNTNFIKALKISRKNWLYPTVLLGTGCLIAGFVVFFVWINPALASLVNNVNVPVSTQENLWAQVDIPKPALKPIDVSVFAPANTTVQTSTPSDTPTFIPTDISMVGAAEAPAISPVATETSGAMTMEIVADTALALASPTEAAQQPYSAAGNDERWIDVNLSEQRVYVYEGDSIVNSFLASTGLPETPTVTGNYRIRTKVRIQDMSGPGYYLRDVPWVMYFYEDYGFHGTYWHNNFGTPMSRGCVNLTVDDAAWLFNWASVGTVVNVHY